MIDIKLKKIEAAEFLNRKGRRIEIIFFALILVFVSFAPVLLYSYSSYIFSFLSNYIQNKAGLTVQQGEITYKLFTCLSVIFSVVMVVFFTFPIYACFFRYSYQTYRDGIAGTPKYFDVEKKDYWRAVRSGLVICLILALCLAPVVSIVLLTGWLATFDDVRIVAIVNYLAFIAVAVALVFGFLIFMAFRSFFLFGYYISREKNVIEALALSLKQMKTKRAKEIYMSYIKAFIPSLLLSLATLLVLFLMDTLPKMTMVYFDIADEIIYGE